MLMQERLIKEMQSRAHLSTYQLEVVSMYMNWQFTLGYDEGRTIFGPPRKPVSKLDKYGRELEIYDSAISAAKSLGVCHTNITAVIKGKRDRCGGFRWKYAFMD